MQFNKINTQENQLFPELVLLFVQRKKNTLFQWENVVVIWKYFLLVSLPGVGGTSGLLLMANTHVNPTRVELPSLGHTELETSSGLKDMKSPVERHIL